MINLKTAKELDQFYTNIKVIPKLYSILESKLNQTGLKMEEFDWLEPSAGSGNFINFIKEKNPKAHVSAFDIMPRNEFGKNKIIKADFINDVNEITHPNKHIITFGNPPFGKKGKLAIDFINKSSKYSDVVAFILPKIFVRYLTQKNINENLELVAQYELEKDSFTINDNVYNVNCVFQIWVNKNAEPFNKISGKRRLRKPPIKTHEDFELFIHNNTEQTKKFFEKEDHKWDYAMHRQGYYDYNKLFENQNDLMQNMNRQYLFIKCAKGKKSNFKKIFKIMDKDELTKWSTSTPGFSNEDFIREYTRAKKIFETGEKNGK